MRTMVRQLSRSNNKDKSSGWGGMKGVLQLGRHHSCRGSLLFSSLLNVSSLKAQRWTELAGEVQASYVYSGGGRDADLGVR